MDFIISEKRLLILSDAFDDRRFQEIQNITHIHGAISWKALLQVGTLYRVKPRGYIMIYHVTTECSLIPHVTMSRDKSS